jgi:hypothetical protein
MCDELDNKKGAEIGLGSVRRVYEMKGDESYVIKELKTDGRTNETDNSNTREWHVWNKIKGWPLDRDLFGRCVEISESGRLLVMERLDDLAPGDKIPSTPVWLRDRKRDNFGKSPCGQIKVRDYGQANVEGVCEESPFFEQIPQEEIVKMGRVMVELDRIEQSDEGRQADS